MGAPEVVLWAWVTYLRSRLAASRNEDGYTTQQQGVHWDGETDVIVRLIWGYDRMRLDPGRWAKRNRKKYVGRHVGEQFRQGGRNPVRYVHV